MILSKDMRTCLKAYKDGSQTGTPHAPELIAKGLLTWVGGDYYTVVTLAGLAACEEATSNLRLFVIGCSDTRMVDVYDEFTILAGSEEEARELANAERGEEGPIWLDPEQTTCQEIELGYAGVVSSSYVGG